MEQKNGQTAAIVLPEAKKKCVQIGCVFLMLSVAMYGLVFATLTAPILENVDAMGYVGLFSIFGAVGVSIMTPIGGKLGDLIGRRNIVVIPGLLCAVCGIAFAFVHALAPLMILRLLIGLAQGAFTAAPYIIVGLINEKKDVPKAMGFLAASISVGGFAGSIIAGVLTDMGLLPAAIIMPAIPLLIGVVLVGCNLPNQKKEGKVMIDGWGMVTLVIALCGILLALNFGSSLGFGHPAILAGFVIGIAALFLFIYVEGKVKEPLIPLRLFKNKNYTILLFIGLICYFYQNAMNIYAPIGAMQVIGTSAGTAGALQMPRMLLTIVLPAFAGAWVGKNSRNAWKSMVIGTALVVIPMAVMGFTTSETNIAVYFVALTVTGVAESFRAVSITPSAQAMLTPEDMGIGTALVNFANSLAGTLSAAAYAVAYNVCTAENPENKVYMQNGVNAVFWTAAIVTLIGLILVLTVVRSSMVRGKNQEEV